MTRGDKTTHTHTHTHKEINEKLLRKKRKEKCLKHWENRASGYNPHFQRVATFGEGRGVVSLENYSRSPTIIAHLSGTRITKSFSLLSVSIVT